MALVGLRLITVPLLPLAGAVIAALAATWFTAVGGSFIGWFVGLAVVGVLAVVACWVALARSASLASTDPDVAVGRRPAVPAVGGGRRAGHPRSSVSGACGGWPRPRWASTPGRCG